MVAQDILDYYRGWLDYRRWFLRVPGLQACVAVDGAPRLSVAFGMADQPAGTPMTDRHRFRIASHSKTYTAVLVLRLVEQGRLRLDDPISAHLPALAGSALASRTVRELLSHGGGVIRDSEDGDFWQLLRPYPGPDELLRIAAAESAAVLPRNQQFKYSNIAYGLLGLVIERAAGTSYADAVRAEILDPLELSGTSPDLTDRELAAGHTALSYATERSVIDPVHTAALAPATGFVATAADLVAFYSALLPGQNRLLDDDAQRQLRHRIWDVKKTDSWYGLGVSLLRVGEHDLFGHGGGFPGHITRTLACPDRRVVASVLTNAVDGPAEPLATALFSLLDAAESASHRPADDGARFVGRFANLWGVADVALLGGRLFALNPMVANPADDPVALEVVDDSTLRMVSGPGSGSIGESMRYDFDSDGSIRSVRGGSGMTMQPFDLPA